MPEFDMEIIQKITALTERCNTAEAERDALAAHVERLICLGREMRREEDDEQAAVISEWFDSALEESPTISLARLKAEWQAEALEDFGSDLIRRSIAIAAGNMARNSAAELRRQAPGGE